MKHSTLPEKVLLTTDTAGGVWTFSLDLARGLQAEGIEVFLASMGPRPSQSKLREARGLLGKQWEHGNFALEWENDPWLQVELAGKWLLGLGDQFKPDLVHINGFAHASLPWKVPVVLGAHSCVLTWWRAVKGEAAPSHFQHYRRQVMKGLEAADAVVAPTASFFRDMEREYGRIRHKHVVSNGRNGSYFTAGKKAPFIFTAGRLWDEAKNIRFLERIAEQLDWPIYVAGGLRHGGNMLSGSPQLHHLGELDSAEMGSVLARASIYVSPARYEPFGLGVLEAALSGCALVLADIPSFREIWGDAAIYLAENKQAWVQTLNWLAGDAAALDGLGQKAKQQAQQYHLRQMTEGCLSVYQGVLAPYFPESDEVLFA